MRDIIESFPEQCRDAWGKGNFAKIPAPFKKRYSSIVFTGMGGSAIGADILRSYLADEARTPIFVNRGYRIPAFAGRDSLVIASSYSGNTEETISSFNEAVGKGARIVVIASGGRLADLARKRSIPVIMIPGGLPPRAALGFSFFTALALLSKLGVISDKSRDVNEAIGVMVRLGRTKIGIDVPGSKNIAKKTAKGIFGKLPVIYSDANHIDAVATRWRGQLAENSKTMASVNVFPEMTHNEIVGWQFPSKTIKNMAVIMLKDRGDDPRSSERMTIVGRMLKMSGVKVTDVGSCGRSLLARVFSLIHTGDYVSLYLAVLNRCDPTPVDRIVRLKKEMAKR